MGGIDPTDELKCFNGAKAWRLEWFTDTRNTANAQGHELVTSGSTWEGKLVGYHDYFLSSGYDPNQNHRVIARAGDLYVWFARAEVFMSDVGGTNENGSNPWSNRSYYQNRVIVTRQYTPDSADVARDANLVSDGTLGIGKLSLVLSLLLKKALFLTKFSFPMLQMRLKPLLLILEVAQVAL